MHMHCSADEQKLWDGLITEVKVQSLQLLNERKNDSSKRAQPIPLYYIMQLHDH